MQHLQQTVDILHFMRGVSVKRSRAVPAGTVGGRIAGPSSLAGAVFLPVVTHGCYHNNQWLDGAA